MGTLADDLGCFPLDNEVHTPLSDCRDSSRGIRSLIWVGKLYAPAPIQCSTSTTYFPSASPRAISGRTSYIQVRLAFHPYPQLIAHFCNNEAFGLPQSFTFVSSWPWVAHLVSGLLLATVALFRLAFAAAPGVLPLNLATESNSLAHSPKGTRSGNVSQRRPPTACKHTVSGSISLRLPRSFSPFPRGTCSLSVAKGI